MHAVDTNVLVRLIARDDVGQTAAPPAFVQRGAWVSHVVLAETVWVLDTVFGSRPAQFATAVEMLLKHHELALQDPDVVHAALACFRKRSKVGLSGRMVLETARKAGHLPLRTFDRQLGKVAGTEPL